MNNASEQFIKSIQAVMPTQVRLNEPMRAHTSFKIGGPADIMVLPQTVEQLAQALKLVQECGLPLTVIGNGSNLLVLDKGIRGVVIKLGNMLKAFKQDGNVLTFGAGYSLSLASKKAYECGLTGMEFAVGIPGSIGGAVYMNAGAYNGEMKNVVQSVKVMTRDGEIKTIGAEELDFGYRHTSLQASDDIVIEVVLEMPTGDKEKIKAEMDDFSQRRISKQPLELPSAGSMFKRPPGYFAGTLIDEAGLKGYRVGDAQVSEKHAGFIVNVGNATAADVLALIKDVQRVVYEKNGVELCREVLVIGEE